eukprot:GHVT01034083.1.p1 GENE.GHVT01034083.1~~GHVT01034083.1.p1  ORF type:complete len:137 (+),score=20.81 GHVT01034083.1:45-455(+)
MGALRSQRTRTRRPANSLGSMDERPRGMAELAAAPRARSRPTLASPLELVATGLEGKGKAWRNDEGEDDEKADGEDEDDGLAPTPPEPRNRRCNSNDETVQDIQPKTNTNTIAKSTISIFTVATFVYIIPPYAAVE